MVNEHNKIPIIASLVLIINAVCIYITEQNNSSSYIFVLMNVVVIKNQYYLG